MITIPKSVEHENLEDQCIKISNEINEHKLEKRDLEAACHKIPVWIMALLSNLLTGKMPMMSQK